MLGIFRKKISTFIYSCAGMGSNLELSKEAEVSRVLQEGISIAKTSKTEKVLAQCSLPNDKKVGINAGSKLKRKELNSQGQPSGARKHKFLQEDASHLLEPRPSNDEVMKDMNKNALSEIFLIRKMVEESRNNVNSVGNSKPSRKLEGLLESFKIRLSAKIPSKQASLGNELDVDKRSLFFEEIEIPLVEMFESIFKSSHESYEKVNRISDNIEIKLVLELLNFIADIKLGKNRLMHNLLKNEINLRGLVWYITTQFIEKWGLMGIFQTADIRKFLLEHEDLSNIRSLLKSIIYLIWFLIMKIASGKC
ncbi:hypothetical protein BY996DRAFT_1935259 [Phakopsora pachyrhizi]|nr:hypothetical protein BY996DRAFT_1935259 [Phakopsora pachyrhizi]